MVRNFGSDCCVCHGVISLRESLWHVGFHSNWRILSRQTGRVRVGRLGPTGQSRKTLLKHAIDCPLKTENEMHTAKRSDTVAQNFSDSWSSWGIRIARQLYRASRSTNSRGCAHFASRFWRFFMKNFHWKSSRENGQRANGLLRTSNNPPGSKGCWATKRAANPTARRTRRKFRNKTGPISGMHLQCRFCILLYSHPHHPVLRQTANIINRAKAIGYILMALRGSN